MQRHNFNSQMYPFNTHQNQHQHPSQIPPIYITLNPPQNPQFQPSNPMIINHPPPHYPFSQDYEQKLKDEVIYLHSLWHKGPPLNPNNTNNFNQKAPTFLKPSISSSKPFKKTKKSSKIIDTHLISDKEWPIESIPTSPSPSGSGWPEFKPVSAPVSRPASAEERGRVVALRVQLKGLDSCCALFDQDDEEEDEEEEDEGDDVEEYEGFMKVFEEDDELRGYYEKNCENGEFYCLVCGVTAKKLSKKYSNCVALVQHSVSIMKTKKRNAHRAYGKVVCKVLGWDINRLPSVPAAAVRDSSSGGGQPLEKEKSSEVQSESKINAEGCDVDDHGGMEKDGVCCNVENVQLENINTLDSVEEVLNKMQEGCSGSGGESVNCGSSVTEYVAK